MENAYNIILNNEDYTFGRFLKICVIYYFVFKTKKIMFL